jgi:DNA repair protein RecN (Recombination protein N)
MLTTLSIRNIVLIEAVDVTFAEGLCVFTGETGAGKSIILDALGFVLGRRMRRSLLRHGQKQGSVAASFALDAFPEPLRLIFEEQGLPLEGEEIRLRRTIDEAGKSRAFVNDMAIGATLLQQIGEELVEIHGQHDQRGLLDPSTHRAVLDAYGQLEPSLAKVKAAYQEYHAAEEAYTALREKREQAMKEQDYLEHVAGELRKLAPEQGEEEQLAERRQHLMKHEKMHAMLGEAQGALEGGGGDSVMARIRSAQNTLARSQIAEEKEVAEVIESLERAMLELEDASARLDAWASAEAVEGDSDRIEERLFALRAAARKYRKTVDELAVYGKEVEAALALISSNDEACQAMEQRCKLTKAAYEKEADFLTGLRAKAAVTLQQAVLSELAPLKMGNTQCVIALSPLPELQWAEHGKDRVELCVSMNPGQPPGAIAKVASGGELSRFMLAVKVVLAGVKSVPVMIFDEVDTGIGGAVADAVGARLKQLAGQVQVLVVTHQPQVASKGNYHIKVEKTADDTTTQTSLHVLSAKERQEELARMLAGESITAEARAAAGRLLEGV